MEFKKYYENTSIGMNVLNQQDIIDAKFIEKINKLRGSIMEFIGHRFAKNPFDKKNHFSTISTMSNMENKVVSSLTNLAEIDVQILDFLYSSRIVNFNQILRAIPESMSELFDFIERISNSDLVPQLEQTKKHIDFNLNKIENNAKQLHKLVHQNDELLNICLYNEKLFSYLYNFDKNQQKEAKEFILNVIDWYNNYVPRFIVDCQEYVNLTINNLNRYVISQYDWKAKMKQKFLFDVNEFKSERSQVNKITQKDWSEYPITFNMFDKQVANIDKNGVFHFVVDPNEENTINFVRMLEKFFNRDITSVKVSESSKNLFTKGRNTSYNESTSDQKDSIQSNFELI